MGRSSAARFLDMSQKTQWVVVATRTRAVFYSVDHRGEKLQFIKRLSNEEGRFADSKLGSSRPGTGFSSAAGGTIHHALDRGFTRHEIVARRFARKIADELSVDRRQRRFRDVVLVAEPHFLGLLRGVLDAPTRKAVAHEVNREYPRGSDASIRVNVFNAIERAAINHQKGI